MSTFAAHLLISPVTAIFVGVVAVEKSSCQFIRLGSRAATSADVQYGLVGAVTINSLDFPEFPVYHIADYQLVVKPFTENWQIMLLNKLKSL